MRVVVVGAGIGGMTAALGLARAGHSVQILERAQGVSPLGAGLQVSANARRILVHLGLGGEFAAIATEPSRIVVRRWDDDSVLGEAPLTGVHDARFGHAFANVARNDLAALLVNAASAMPNIDIRFGVQVEEIDQSGSHPVVRCADGAFDADVVIGADGIHSVVRGVVAGEDSPRFSGWAAFRAQVPRGRVEHLPVETTNRVGPGAHVVSYFIGRNRSHLNLVFIAPETEWKGESWTEQTSLASLREAFHGWSPQLQDIISAVEEPVYKWALYDREPLSTWCNGSVALLGDAAHPMLPFMAQGACQAIEDAAVLVRCLEGVESRSAAVSRALLSYEATRIERATRIQSGSYLNRIVFHYPDGEEQVARDAMFASDRWSSATDWVYEHDALTTPLVSG
ncbi:MAG: FAD-binding protein [Actinobacteria bacterium]|nr:FAD-binding protein [Actinomycetota bacterium]